ncbi:ComF family protein [Luteolibacter marinus]|uniref:ComF family protein n=1 Tax=Luteolibacter marinus TaxID=2776705 RepID=UPI001865DF22|nr:ComF family protein [Luteolibacter marinus]
MSLDPAKRVKGVWAEVLDLLYPGICQVCGGGLTGDRSLCEGCVAEVPGLKEPFCRRCGEEFDGQAGAGAECPNCRNLTFAFDFARPAVPCHPAILEMIHGLKYSRRIELAPELGRVAVRAFEDDPRLEPALAGGWSLVPVPLHRTRELWRHFNQAAEIARPMARGTGLPVCHALTRVRSTGNQTRLNRAQRLKNLKGAFALSKEGAKLAGGKPPGVVLVDDVFTTGATSDECARALRRGGVQKVVVVTVMRG